MLALQTKPKKKNVHKYCFFLFNLHNTCTIWWNVIFNIYTIVASRDCFPSLFKVSRQSCNLSKLSTLPSVFVSHVWSVNTRQMLQNTKIKLIFICGWCSHRQRERDRDTLCYKLNEFKCVRLGCAMFLSQRTHQLLGALCWMQRLLDDRYMRMICHLQVNPELRSLRVSRWIYSFPLHFFVHTKVAWKYLVNRKMRLFFRIYEDVCVMRRLIVGEIIRS